MDPAGLRRRHAVGRLRCRGPDPGLAADPAGSTRREPDVTDQHDGRAGFGNRLRRLREDADLSGKQLAELLEWPASKVSRLENGKQTATAADVRAWASATGVPAPVCDELVDDLRSLRVEYATWQRQLRGGLRATPAGRAGA